MTRRLFFPTAVAAAVLLGSCAEPTAPQRPIPGTLELRWTSPHADDAAALLRIVLPEGVETPLVEPVGADVEMFHRRVADTLHVAVFGTLPTGTLLRLEVSDVRRVSQATATLLEVSDAADVLRASLDGYAATVLRP